MRSSFIFVAMMLSLACSRTAMAADVLVGSFEGTTLGSGWNDWNYNGPHEFANSATGATNGSMSIKVTPGTIGYAQSLTLKLQELPSPLREQAFDGFLNNTHLAFDVTWDASEWHYQGTGWNGARFWLTYNEQGAGYNPPFGINPDANGFTQPNIDTGNPTNQGFWDITNYPGVHTRTVMWDYTHLLPLLTSTATGGWTEFFLVTNFGAFDWPASIYIDNVRFTTPPAEVPLPGDFNGDDVVDAADYTVWRDNLGATDDVVLNGNGDEVAGVGPGDYALWKESFGDVPAGAGAAAVVGAVGVPEPSAFALALFAISLTSLARRRG
jgi:hypothetical protein